MDRYPQIFCIVFGYLALTSYGCSGAEQGDQMPNHVEPAPTLVDVDPKSNTGDSASFAAYATLCELVKASCGQGEILKHERTEGPVEVDGLILTTHIFLNSSGETFQVLEECGQVATSAGNTSGGQCRLDSLIEGDAFIVWSNDGYLVQVFRGDQVAGMVTDVYGSITTFRDLADLDTRWSSLDELGPNCDSPIPSSCSFQIY